MDAIGNRGLGSGCGQRWDKPRDRSGDKFGDEFAPHYESGRGVIPTHQMRSCAQAGDSGEKFDSTQTAWRFGLRRAALSTAG